MLLSNKQIKYVSTRCVNIFAIKIRKENYNIITYNKNIIKIILFIN